MVDFKKLMGSRPAGQDPDPRKIFASLDRKASHAALRTAQEEALAKLHERRDARDLILKMPTGLGKTSVGLLYLQSYMAASGRGAVYLCPTVQLVRQVLDEAARLGVKAHEYPAGQPHPPAECLGGRAVAVCTYDKMFNARSTFQRSDVQFNPEAIVCDDAHAGVEEVLDAFTLRVGEPGTYEELRAVFADASATSTPGPWDDVLVGDPGAVVEVPYWTWATLREAAQRVLQAHADDREVKFVWPRLRERLAWTRVVVSASAVEISPVAPFVEDVLPFTNAKHRLFMSATLADDAALVRALGCDPYAAREPVRVGSDSPPGERLVVAPSLVDPTLDRAWLIDWAARTAVRHSVVVLASSLKQAADWERVGAQLGAGPTIERVVDGLRGGSVGFAVFAQRYDGVDLPDDACRVLILDGMPHGESATDMRDRTRTQMATGPRAKMVHRIEQGMGRAVRSPADFAAVILAGPELGSYVSNVDVYRHFGRDLQLQLEVARELADYAREEGTPPQTVFESLVDQLLRRDAGWRAYYDDRVRNRLQADPITIDRAAVDIAEAERNALRLAMNGDGNGAGHVLTAALELAASDARRADLLEAKARFIHPLDPAEAMRLQTAAHAASTSVARPPIGSVVRPPVARDAASRLIDLARSHTSPNGLVAQFDALRARLTFDSSASQFELAVQELGTFLGAESRRPEKEDGEGPDNLLAWTDLSIVAEAKNEAGYAAIPKKDAEQLLHSVQWFKDKNLAPHDPVPVFFGPSQTYDTGVHGPPGARVVFRDHLAALVDAVRQVVARLAGKPATDWTAADVHRLLAGHGLNGSQLVQRYSRPVSGG
ncbi:MAG: DEAD/DEAH box helicase family protein [Sandaracinaceae bacterium]